MSVSRRSFLKLSLGSLLATAVSTNPVLSVISNSVSEFPYKVFLYLIQTKSGKWRVKGTTCINIDNVKISPNKFNIDTFKPLGVYNSDKCNDKKLEFWNYYNCGKGFQQVNYQLRINNGKKAKVSGQLKSICSKGGSVGGKLNSDNKHGLFSLTKEQRILASSMGGKKSITHLLQWCENNNHWDTIGNIHKDVPKSEEHKKKISNTLKGRPITEETKQKMSKSRMGHGWSEQAIENLKKGARKRCKPILQFDLNGNLIKEWEGFAYIVDELQLEKSGVYLCCKGKIQKSQGFIWKYKDSTQ